MAARRKTGNGRHARIALTRAAVLNATRQLMLGGNFRPTAAEIVAADGFAARSINQHFRTLDALYAAAVDDDTAEAIVAQLPVDDHRRLALTVVLGRLIEVTP